MSGSIGCHRAVPLRGRFNMSADMTSPAVSHDASHLRGKTQVSPQEVPTSWQDDAIERATKRNTGLWLGVALCCLLGAAFWIGLGLVFDLIKV